MNACLLPHQIQSQKVVVVALAENRRSRRSYPILAVPMQNTTRLTRMSVASSQCDPRRSSCHSLPACRIHQCRWQSSLTQPALVSLSIAVFVVLHSKLLSVVSAGPLSEGPSHITEVVTQVALPQPSLSTSPVQMAIVADSAGFGKSEHCSVCFTPQ